MDLSALLQPVHAHPAYQRLLQQLRGYGPPRRPLGLLRAARPAVAAAIATDTQRPVLLLVPRRDRALTLAEEIPTWAPDLQPLLFREPNPLFYEKSPWGPRTIRSRLHALAALTEGQQPGADEEARSRVPQILIATVRSCMTRTLPPRDFIANSRWLRQGRSLQLERLLRHLVDIGYQRETLVTAPGQFSRRGGILDLWPPAQSSPIRLDLFGEEIESLQSFDPASQRSSRQMEGVRVTPAREMLPKNYEQAWDRFQPPSDSPSGRLLLEFFLGWMHPAPSGLLDYLAPDTLILLDDRLAVEGVVNEIETQAVALKAEMVQAGELPEDAPLPYLTLAELTDAMAGRQSLDLGLMGGEIEGKTGLHAAFQPGPRFGGQLRPVMDFLAQRRMLHESVVVVSRQAARLADLSARENLPRSVQEGLSQKPIPGDLQFVSGALSEGWTLQQEGGTQVHLMTDAEIFGWSRPKPRPRPRARAEAPESAYADLNPEDWVVHIDHGVARFLGLVERTIGGLPREYLLLAFGGGDRVYVPIHQADRVTKYVGADGAEPKPSRLGTREWERAKGKVHQAVEEVAKDLLQLYAKRMAIEGHAFAPDTSWQRELELSFPYLETEDQLRAIRAVKRDMERPRPMDRLICGDVGYGKTEVALRAAFKAVMDGKQVAMLVPTTVLAQQHFNTFRHRLSAFPVELEMLSRFRSPSEIEDILHRLRAGEIDIVIGTHRLLQKDVSFKDLGLLIIDEEQRFGVTHKEFLKRKRTEVDVLTMTATPIPRTLYMALTGARDISTIDTPPEERLPVITHVGPYDPKMIRQAVLRELDRGGQVFFVHNRVQTIEGMRRRLERLVPEAKIAVGHGQLPERELSQVMAGFNEGEVDLLVSTSIIESGLDIPNANTLIVDQADRFGLSQLYQLRGRVGRGAARGYAYFFRHPNQRSSEEALERLEVIAEHTQLGSGYSIAMRDLELRGAGDILGTRQHGHISAVGFHLYTRLLSGAVRRLRSEYEEALPEAEGFAEASMPLSASIDLPIPSVIPPDYVPDRDLRLQLYRRLAEIRSESELRTLESELEDRFGAPPPEVGNLLYQLRARIIAADAQVISVSTEGGQVLIQLPPEWDRERLRELEPEVRVSRRGLWINRSREDPWREHLIRVLESLRDLNKVEAPLAPRLDPG